MNGWTLLYSGKLKFSDFFTSFSSFLCGSDITQWSPITVTRNSIQNKISYKETAMTCSKDTHIYGHMFPKCDTCLHLMGGEYENFVLHLRCSAWSAPQFQLGGSLTTLRVCLVL